MWGAMPPTSATRRRPSPASEAWALMHELLHASRRRFLAIAAEFELSPPQVRALGTREATITSRLYRARAQVARGMEPHREGVL